MCWPRPSPAAATADLASESGDPTELALLGYAAGHGTALEPTTRETERLTLYSFDPRLKRMSTVDSIGGSLYVATKGAPEQILPRCSSAYDTSGAELPLTPVLRERISERVDEMAGRALRVLAVARRGVPVLPAEPRRGRVGPVPAGAGRAPRPAASRGRRRRRELPSAGITVHVVTGDNGLTAAEIARRVGIGADRVINGDELDADAGPGARRGTRRAAGRSSSPAPRQRTSCASPTRCATAARSWR